jgi:hypothetical protein
MFGSARFGSARFGRGKGGVKQGLWSSGEDNIRTFLGRGRGIPQPSGLRTCSNNIPQIKVYSSTFIQVLTSICMRF